MIVAETVVGSIAAFDDRTIEYVRLSDAERKRSRVRTTTDAGTDVGLVLGDTSVEAGDVVYADDDRAIAIAFEDRPALAIDVSALADDGGTHGCLLELGHFLGNRHYDLVVEGATAFVPVEADRPIADAIRARLPDGAEVTRRTVDPTLFDESDPPEHSHSSPDHAHASGDRDRGSTHEHEPNGHAHGSGHEHAHGPAHEHAHGSAHEHGHDATGSGRFDDTGGSG
ncbi:Urease accessory protein UreE [Halorhabdus sp. SVX81]|uniref:hypothetical protein n=1 Tax=Halorhabdus sp. SVX81 TaxID=2978283 RepID=UPI0023D9E2CE|nr:hypothetical protein [Halorhabdus sp. SVX81]WEL18368.1 Urease accessory protein UreE [Halorhabdus sp. SVX81]